MEVDIFDNNFKTRYETACLNREHVRVKEPGFLVDSGSLKK